MSSSDSFCPPKLARIVERFQRRPDPKQRYRQLLAYAGKLATMPEAGKVPANKVSGCVSQVFITAHLEAGTIQYQGDSDAQLVKGLVALLIEGLNGLTPTEVTQVSPAFIEAMGINASLTPSRANGFYNIFKMMQQKAVVLQWADETAED